MDQKITKLMQERINLAREYQRTHKGRLPDIHDLVELTGANAGALWHMIGKLRSMDIQIVRDQTKEERAANIDKGMKKYGSR